MQRAQVLANLRRKFLTNEMPGTNVTALLLGVREPCGLLFSSFLAPSIRCGF
jgi:hypothetical protein